MDPDGGPSPLNPQLLPQSRRRKPEEYFWLWVMCLLGLDYFTTLAYQPSITFETAGRLGPIATAVVVLVTLFGALPIYYYLVGRAPTGHGSIGMIEGLVRGWKGKTLVLILLGFAATDFTLLRTISLADASVHVVQAQDGTWQQALVNISTWVRERMIELFGEEAREYCTDQLMGTLLLGVLGFLFWYILRRGFSRNVLVLAVPLVLVYLLLNALILGGGLVYLWNNPDLITEWMDQVHRGDWYVEPPFAGFGWFSVALFSLLFLPKLALGLSGFEMNMIVIPQVRGKEGEDPPRTRVRNTRWVLLLAALIMSVYLLASALVTCILIPPMEMQPEGKAANRALAYLAHGSDLTVGPGTLLPFCGPFFGSLYDLVTVLILSLAGTSVVAALAVLLPQFLLRFGMEFRWAHRWSILLVLFALINLLVTLYFQASVDAQRNAYASGVMVLIACAAMVTVLDKSHAWKASPRGFWSFVNLWYFRVLAGGFVLLALAVVVRSFSGLAIAALFIGALLVMSVISRAYRADEMRTIGFDFKDEQSKFLWDSLRMADFPVLVPHRPGRFNREDKEIQIRCEHQLAPDADTVFVEVEVDDPSNFYQKLMIEVVQEDHRFVIKVTRCVSVAHAIAAIAMEMSKLSRPPGVHFGWSEMSLLTASWSYFAFGEGNIPWKVRELIHRNEPDPEKRPRVIVG